MTSWQAAGHYAGAVVLSVALGIGWFWLGAWEEGRNRNRALEEIALALGVSVEELSDERMTPKILDFLGARFSYELFRNRLADFIGVSLAIWRWMGYLIELLVLGVVAWYTVTDDRSAAVFAWLIIPLNLFVMASIVIAGIACKILTARYPSQPRNGRMIVAEAWKRHREASLAALK